VVSILKSISDKKEPRQAGLFLRLVVEPWGIEPQIRGLNPRHKSTSVPLMQAREGAEIKHKKCLRRHLGAEIKHKKCSREHFSI